MPGGAWPRPTVTEYLCLIGGAYLCLAYAWLLDDAFVYFKYIDNWLLLDRGLVYNPGEYAEGYTSPAWLLLLAGLRSLGLGYWLVARAVALVAFACFWLGCVLIHRRLAPAGVPTLNLPLVILCVNYAVLCYFSSGTEAPLVQLSAVAYGLLLLYPAWLPGQLAVGISPLVRPELALAWLLVVAWLAWQRRPAAWRVMVIGVAAGGAWLVFRVLYYADVFPTTFYLKAGSDPGQGWRYLHDTLAPYHLYAWIALGLAGLLAVRRRRAESSPLTQARLGMLGAAAAIALYVVWIGGDARHYRYLAFPVCLALLAFGGLAEHAMRMRGIRLSPAAHTLLGLAVALGSAALYPRQLAAHPVRETAVRGVPALGHAAIVDEIADAAMHRFHPDLEYLSPWGDGSAIEMRPRYQSWRAAGRGDTPPRVIASPICWSHYQHFDEWSIHRFGLTDGVLARMRVRSSAEDRPGHTIALRKPARELAAILEWWSRPPRRGMYRAAVDAGVAPQWVRDNLATLELLERKLYGPRTAWESAKLAAHFRERIDLDGSR